MQNCPILKYEGYHTGSAVNASPYQSIFSITTDCINYISTLQNRCKFTKTSSTVNVIAPNLFASEKHLCCLIIKWWYKTINHKHKPPFHCWLTYSYMRHTENNLWFPKFLKVGRKCLKDLFRFIHFFHLVFWYHTSYFRKYA